MNKILSRVLAPFVISFLSTSMVFAEQNTLDKLPELPTVRVVKSDNPTYIESTHCGMTIGEEGVEGGYFVLKNDIICAPNEIELLETNAALTIAGSNTYVDLNGHNIICAGTKSYTSKRGTNQMQTIGIHLPGTGSTIVGSEDESVYANVVGCNVGVEIGYVNLPQPISRQQPASGRHHVSKIQVLACNAGIRALNSDNVVTQNKVTCQYNKLGYGLGSADGYVVGIKGLQDDFNHCTSNEKIPSVYRNYFIDNIAYGNINGFLGGNQMQPSGFWQGRDKVSNVLRNNVAKYNRDHGFYIRGTGHLVTLNKSIHDNGKSGITVSRKHPTCGPQNGKTNIISHNSTYYNGNGIAAVQQPRTYLNGGAVFESNTSFNNHRLDLSDDNAETGGCASLFIPSDLDFLNRWINNEANPRRVNPLCTLGFMPSRP